MGEAGGDWLSSSVAVSISAPTGGGCRISWGGVEHHRVGGAGQLGHSLKRAVCSPLQLRQRAGEEEPQQRVALRLPLGGQVGFGQQLFERE